MSDTVSQVIGFNLEDISKIDPFKTIYHSVYFVIFALFMICVVGMILIAFVYPFCNCFCSGAQTTKEEQTDKKKAEEQPPIKMKTKDTKLKMRNNKIKDESW